MEKLCNDCEDREHCQTPCKAVNAILWEDNHVMEKHYSDAIVVFPGSGKERHFSELTDKQLAEISEIDVIPWSSGDTNLRKTAVFIERFFNKVPCKELAERFRVKENTIVCMYRDAVEQIERLVRALDARREGIKQVQTDRFNDDEKMFLLVYVFGFNQTEVARMFEKDHRFVSAKLKPMADKFSEIFGNQKKKPVKSVYEGLSKDEIVKRMTGQ